MKPDREASIRRDRWVALLQLLGLLLTPWIRETRDPGVGSVSVLRATPPGGASPP